MSLQVLVHAAKNTGRPNFLIGTMSLDEIPQVGQLLLIGSEVGLKVEKVSETMITLLATQADLITLSQDTKHWEDHST